MDVCSERRRQTLRLGAIGPLPTCPLEPSRRRQQRHGGAALVNALEVAGKRIEDVQVVVNGAGSASLACANLYLRLGVRQENPLMCDSRGVIYQGRK